MKPHPENAGVHWVGRLLSKIGGRTRVALCALLLFLVNVSICAQLFGIEFIEPLLSPEGSFIAISRIMMEKPGENLWWPYWDAGMPFHHSYVPLVPRMTAVAAQITGWSPALAYHAVVAFFYCFGPVALFLMAWVMTRKTAASFLCGLLYSLVSPSGLLFPAIAADTGGVWNARRLYVLTHYGAGPQVTALDLLPVAVLFLYLSLERRKPLLYLATGVSMAAVVLTNAFGATTLAMAALCLLCARSEGSFGRDLRLTLAISLPAYLWISPWLPPSLLRSMAFNSQTAGGAFPWLSPVLLASVALLAGFFLLSRLTRGKLPVYLRFFLLFSWLLTVIPTLGYIAEWHVLPQSLRYHLEMEAALCLLVVFGLQPLAARLPKPVTTAALAVGIGLAGLQWSNYRAHARELIQSPDLEQTAEYRVAQHLTQLFGGRRVMASGTCSIWLSVFSDTPQLSGGHEPSSPNWMQRIAVFTTYTGMNAGPRDGEIAVLWLKAFGVHAVHVPGPESREHDKPFANPRKFEGLLPVVWQEAGDTIYAVPQRSDSLVYAAPRSALVDQEPRHGLDVEQIERYVNAIEDPALPLPEVTWRSSHSALIRATLAPEQALSVQINYASGWKATVDGRTQPVGRDGLGLLVIQPDCRGPCEIELVYDGGLERQATRAASIATMIGVLAWLAIAWRKHAGAEP
jgi:hypothetical protein